MNDLYYIIKIRLNRFTYDLSRSLCAFLTGVTGDVGDPKAEVYADKKVEKIFHDSMRLETSQAGWTFPARTHQKELHLLFDKKPTQQQIDTINKRLPLFEEAFMEKDEYAAYIGRLDLKVERVELVKIEVKETPLRILDEPKSAL